MQKHLCFLLWGLTLSVGSHAQSHHLQLQHLTMREGLPNYYIRHVMIDREGFARIATNYGYCRFDGYEVQVYNQPKGLSFNRQLSSFQDVQGLIWISYFSMPGRVGWLTQNEKLLEVYDPDSRRMTSFDEKFAGVAPFHAIEIATFTADEAHHMWIITTSQEVYKYDGTFHKVGILPKKVAFHNNDELNVTYQSLVLAHNDELYITDRWSKSLFRMNGNGVVEQMKLPELIGWMWVDQDDVLWILPQYSAQIWRKRGEEDFQIITLPIAENRSIPKETVQLFGASDTQRRLWIFRYGVLYVFNEGGKLLYKLTTNEEEFSPEEVSNMLIDNQDCAWLSTSYGVYILSLKKKVFTNYLNDRGIQDTRGIVVDEQNRIFVNQAGLYLIEEGKSAQKIAAAHMLNLIKYKNELWAGAYHPKVFKFDITQLGKSEIQADSMILQGANALLLHRSKQTGKLWVAGRSLFGHVDMPFQKFTASKTLPAFASLQQAFVNGFYENDEGIWIATDKGIYLLDEAKGIVAHFAQEFPNQNVMHLYEDKAKIMWLATRGGGLLRWDRHTGAVQQFTAKKNGLSNDVLYAIYEDDFGYLWLPSNYGLMRFNKKTYQINVFLPQDGLPYHEFNYTSHTRAPDGRLFFGGLKGVTSFHPKDFLVHDTPNQIPIQILNFQKLNKEGVLKDFTTDLLNTGKIILEPRERSIWLSFALLNYMTIKENHYAYFIEGFDKKWNYIDENYIRLNSLPYGNYTLRIKAKDENGRWSQQELNIPVIVKRPFYLAWWFITLVMIIFLAIIRAERYWHALKFKQQNKKLEAEVARRTATIQRQAEELKLLDEQKSNFFLNIAHDLRTPLTLISSPISLFLEREQVDAKVATFLRSIKKNTNYLLDLVEGILNLSKLDAKQLTLQEQPVHIHSLIQRIFAMYESYAKMHHIKYESAYKADKDLQLLLDVSKFEKIVNNLLSNAIKFTKEGGRVFLNVWESAHQLHLEVTDTGKGIHPDDLPHIFERYFQTKQAGMVSQGGSGIGLAIAWEYVHLMNGTLDVESHWGLGSTFTLVVPKKISPDLLAPAIVPKPMQEEENRIRAEEHLNKQYTVLLVDDNVQMQKLLLDIVEPQYKVLQAENGATALKLLDRNLVHGIITDLMMPQMDGFEFIEKLKANDSWRFTPVLVLTARANEQDKLQALRMGIDDYLFKPFVPQELLIRIQNLIDNYQKRVNTRSLMNGHGKIVSADDKWLQEAEMHTLNLINIKISFNISEVAKLMHMSERHFHRKIQLLTGLTANNYIKEIRLQRAKQLLEARAKTTISEVAYDVGFSSSSYFTKVYTERFGKKPSEYA